MIKNYLKLVHKNNKLKYNNIDKLKNHIYVTHA
jgi:hypothetical protein